MEASHFQSILLENFKWLNEPLKWTLNNNILQVTTKKSDFWQETWYDFHFNSGHVYGVNIKDDFTFTACVKADFTTLYDQAGLMIYVDEKHWLKAGIEFNDGQPMIGTVLTNQRSDWATGVYNGDAHKFWIRLSRVGPVVCVKYSSDNVKWHLLRLCPFVEASQYFVGLMCCTPQRSGLNVTFENVKIEKPDKDILHSN